MFSAKVLADSVNKVGDRLVTIEATYPRCIHSEIMTHRVFSRNAASSRAVPVHKKIEEVRKSPFVPIHWGLAESGMQARAVASDDVAEVARDYWLGAAKSAVMYAELLKELGIHKQVINRVLEPFTWITVIISSTSWEHFFNLRVHEDAEPHMQRIAALVYRAIQESKPTKLKDGGWHLPLVNDQDRKEFSSEQLAALSVARCARVSYLTHDGKRDPNKDIELHNRLAKSGHWSPFEHAAQAASTTERSGNFSGFNQYRKRFGNEFVAERPYKGEEGA